MVSWVKLKEWVGATFAGSLQPTRSDWIFALRTFSGRFGTETQAAVTASGDPRVSYVDTTGWLASDDLSDSVHPNDKGHRTITDRLAPVISARLG